MIQASLARCWIEVDGVLMLMGFSTLLIPVAEYADTVQWHLEISERQEINPWDLCDKIPIRYKATWAKGSSLSTICEKRAYLGTGMRTFINLGTTKSRDRCGWTALKSSKRQPILHSFTVGIANAGPANFGMTGTATFTFAKQSLTQTIEKNYSLILEAAKGQLACLYDASECRAWMVPTTSLLLEMIHLHVRVKGNYNSDDLPIAEKVWDGDQAAYEAMVGKESLLLRRKVTSRNDGSEVILVKAPLSTLSSTASTSGGSERLNPAVGTVNTHEASKDVEAQDRQVLNSNGGGGNKSTICLETMVETAVDKSTKDEDYLEHFVTKLGKRISEPTGQVKQQKKPPKMLKPLPGPDSQDTAKVSPGTCQFADLVDYLYGPIQRAKHQRSSKPLFALGRPYMHGWELMDVVSLDADIRGKQHILKSSAGRWPEMLEGIPTFFAADMENIIDIDDTSSCLDCRSVPKGRDLLAIQSRSLYKLSAKNGYAVPRDELSSLKIAKKLWWNPDPNPFEDCHASASSSTKNCWTGRLQNRLQSRPKTGLWKRGHRVHEDGVVVFGRRKDLPTLKAGELQHA
ncbi:ankyrin repeat protein [Phlyctema vagabunda]|uniref:Ankyrin repeat protein n=1 Tax=Phlyctema vagabunda TaxID=108571 RepID=A0ABR4PB16_9HELO